MYRDDLRDEVKRLKTTDPTLCEKIRRAASSIADLREQSLYSRLS